jgi:hypothetical protein
MLGFREKHVFKRTRFLLNTPLHFAYLYTPQNNASKYPILTNLIRSHKLFFFTTRHTSLKQYKYTDLVYFESSFYNIIYLLITLIWIHSLFLFFWKKIKKSFAKFWPHRIKWKILFQTPHFGKLSSNPLQKKKFLSKNYTTFSLTIISLQSYALNAEFQHFKMLKI